MTEKEIKKFEQDFNKKLEKFKAKEVKLNLETSQYVQIVTSQRIQWLEKIRDDLASIISLYRILYYHNDVISGIVQGLFSGMVQNLPKAIEEFQKNDFLVKLYMESSQSKEKTTGELLGQIAKLKLRLNPIEDIEIISILDTLEADILSGKNKDKVYQLIKELTSHLQKVLKTEWEKVKSEVKYGDSIRGEKQTM
jgi:hypothetical protein